jgi:hypothetical protein
VQGAQKKTTKKPLFSELFLEGVIIGNRLGVRAEGDDMLLVDLD